MEKHDINSIVSSLLSGQKSKQPLCLFDLDSTLYNVSPRTQKILLEFCKDPEMVKAYPKETQTIPTISISTEDWGFAEALDRENFQSSITFFKDLNKFWRKYFFSNHYLEQDTLYTKATEFVKKVENLGFTIIYLTGRNQDLMREGSLKNLLRDQFPYTDNSSLIMKTDKKLNDSLFKSNIIDDLKRKYDKILFFENEPTIINKVHDDHPEVTLFFMDSTHSRQENIKNKIPTIKQDFSPLCQALDAF